MRGNQRQQISISPGSSLSGAGGALLLLFFFTPWLSACGITASGKTLAFGVDVAAGVSTRGSYPWLVLVLVAALAVVVITLLNLRQPSAVIRQRAGIAVLAGGLALVLMLIVGISFVSQANSAENAIYDMRLEYGYYASLLAASAILAGGLMDSRGQLGTPVRGLRFPQISTPGMASHRSPPQAYGTPPSANVRAKLIIQSGPLAGQAVPMQTDRLLIGRGSDCDLQLHDKAVSRHHALLRYAQGAWFVQDQQSRGGTRVNGSVVTATRLHPEDRITIGSNTIIFRPEI